MPKIVIIAAMQKEADLLRRLERPNLSVVECGIGKVAAALATQRTIDAQKPDLIINSGVAGGLMSDLSIGEVVIGEKMCYHDVWCGEPNAYGQVQGFPLFYASDSAVVAKLDKNIRHSLIISGDCFVTQKTELERLKTLFPEAVAVDMESAAVAQTCFISRVPMLSLRLISDTVGADHHSEQYTNFWQMAAEHSFETVCRVLEKI